ncbi:Variant surface glycoprotein [Trypanosoma grayi]|uniref:Variant surface glycoprotein n=1 Tax=Trypanosoma grayi TaxID=71804 RepID=UPI0004F42ABC|nr:Variant surface glycoprotein [Trypanosoma grayi]KEG14241.1 Variant surface glycoprotein [Trypanosoma grayi]
MLFGSEPPLYLKPVGRRGLRRHEADALQHYPGYLHPMEQQPGGEGYMSDAHRLHPLLTPAEELRRERNEKAKRQQCALAVRQQRHNEREMKLMERREEEFQREQRHKAQIAGLSIRNEPGDGRDTVTRQYRTLEALRRHEHQHAVEEHIYFARQRRLVERNNPHGYNIVTGEPLPAILVPPVPSLSPSVSPALENV